ncbi:MAG: type II secretion system minor pseudopilin GspK [Pseudomonadales bacterium]|nr:type II secretion system minor pseudopilin GspK [Pseudomonadales bacterium]MCP5185787.1 type II secretion system minor pseudopilin GspK [Pseudomonadales bacterium]
MADSIRRDAIARRGGPGAQRGVALLMVLMFFAFLSAIAVRLSVNHSLLIAQGQNAFSADLARAYALGAEELVRQVLYQDFTETGAGVDTLEEIWATAVPPFEVDEGGYIEIQVRDLQGCFNLNAVGGGDDTAPNREALKRLLMRLGAPEALADRIHDWEDEDQVVDGFGAESSDYELSDPPYRAADQLLSSVSELRLMLQPGEEDPLRGLEPRVCVLPGDTSLKVNVNTASAEVLAALVANADTESLVQFAASPRTLSSVEDFVSAYPDFGAVASSLRVTSDWFRMDARVEVGGATVILSSLLRRDGEKGTVEVVGRDYGRAFHTRIRVETEEAS